MVYASNMILIAAIICISVFKNFENGLSWNGYISNLVGKNVPISAISTKNYIFIMNGVPKYNAEKLIKIALVIPTFIKLWF